MPTYEHAALLQHKDQNGDTHIDYPITKAENVDGLYESPALTGIPIAPTAESGTNTTQIATTEFVQTEISDLKKSVSDGKTAVANAITAKGVETAADATFAVMANNIASISSSSSGTSLNIFTQLDEPDIKEGIWVETSNQYNKVIIDNIVLSEDGIWNDTIEDLPFSIGRYSAVIYNNELHILQCETANGNGHYKWNGSSWTSVSTLPSINATGMAEVYNGEIHIHYCNSNNNIIYHYKWNGTSWKQMNGGPYGFYQGNVVVYNNELHIMGGAYDYYKHYKWNGSSWTSVSTLPFISWLSSATVYQGAIHLLGSASSSGNPQRKHYKWDGSSWVSVSTIPYNFGNGAAVTFGNAIHILGSYDYNTRHYKWNGSSWTSASTLPFNFAYGSAIAYDNASFMILIAQKRSTYSIPTNVYDPYTLIINRSDSYDGVYKTALVDTSFINGANNSFQTGFDDVWYFGESSFESTPIYYGDGTQWIKIKN